MCSGQIAFTAILVDVETTIELIWFAREFPLNMSPRLARNLTWTLVFDLGKASTSRPRLENDHFDLHMYLHSLRRPPAELRRNCDMRRIIRSSHDCGGFHQVCSKFPMDLAGLRRQTCIPRMYTTVYAGVARPLHSQQRQQ